MIDVDYNEYKETLSENMKLIIENNRLKEVEKEHQKLNGELREEIGRLNSIINNIENDLLDRYYGRGKYHLSTDIIGIPTFYKKIKELKGSDKE